MARALHSLDRLQTSASALGPSNLQVLVIMNMEGRFLASSFKADSTPRLITLTPANSAVFDLTRFPEELREEIMDFCDMRTMVALGSTSRYWDRKRGECFYFRVVNILKQFQLEPKIFLEFLTRTSTVISGSAALLVFYPGLFIPGDLDIYCSESSLSEVLDFFQVFTKYSMPKESPTREELSKDKDYDDWVFSESHLAKVLKIYGPPYPDSNREPPMVNIIVVRNVMDPISAISHFHSTPVMNLVTGRGVICVYPELTLRMRGIINTHRSSMATTAKFTACLDKYRERGFDLALTLGKWPGLRPDFANKRRLGDMPLCTVAFPELAATSERERMPKQVVLKEDQWNTEWELSEWGVPTCAL